MKKNILKISVATLLGLLVVTSCDNSNSNYTSTPLLTETSGITGTTSATSSNTSSIPTTTTENVTTAPSTTTSVTTTRPTNTTTSETTTKPNELPTEYTGYYSKMTGNLGSTFKSTLHDIISSNLKPSSYSNAWTILKEAEEYDQNNIKCFYTGRIIPKNAQVGSNTSGQSVEWNREHVWAKSHGFGDLTSNYAYYDAFHLHATEEKINSTRGNLPFDDVDGGSSDSYGNSWNSTAFEPRDEVKGDVARSLFYMVVRYDDSTLDLELEDKLTSTTSKEPTLGKLSTLVRWAYEDPVSEEEIRRNEVVYGYQGNRNPFIDHPEFIYYLYTSESNKLGITLDNLADYVYADDNGGSISPNPNPDKDPVSDAVKNVIELINKIGTVTSSSKTAIDNAFAAYNALSSDEKDLVTNYSVLVDANNQYELLYGSDVKYSASFLNISESFGYTADKTFILNDVSWFASNAYKSPDFRLGHNKATTLDSKLGLGNLDGSYLEASFNNVSSIYFNATGKYGTISNCYMMYSADGINYEILQEFGAISGAKALTVSLDREISGYIALVIVGSAPRLILSEIVIK